MVVRIRLRVDSGGIRVRIKVTGSVNERFRLKVSGSAET